MVDLVPYLRLRAPVGDGQENNPDDVEALDGAIRRIDAYSPPPEYRDGPQRYTTTPMIDAVRRLQSENALLVDGAALPGGPTERLINNALLAKPRGASLLFSPIAPLSGDVGDGRANARNDVAGVQRGLGALGYGPEDPFDRPHGFIDARTIDGVKLFQRDKGLTPDGWMAPGGETERAMKHSLEHLAHVKRREWMAFAERAESAQEDLNSPPSSERAGEDNAKLTPVAWFGAPPSSAAKRDLLQPSDERDEGRVEPAQTAPGDYIVPFLFLTLPALLGLGEANRRRLDAEKHALDEDEIDSGKVEQIPPYVPNGPMRGPDPAKPPLDPSETRTPPSADQPPPSPNREELNPPRFDPRDFILITPDQSELSAQYIFTENRGNEKTRRALSVVADAARRTQELRPNVKIVHIGGSRDPDGKEVKEHHEWNRDKSPDDPLGRRGSSLADLTLYIDEKFFLHISFHRSKRSGEPLPIEVDQALRLARNSSKPAIVVMIENKHGARPINQAALEKYLVTVIDALLAGEGNGHINVRDPKVRDRIIRYFDAYKPN